MYIVTLVDPIDVPVSKDTRVDTENTLNTAPTASFPFDSDTGEDFAQVRTFTVESAHINSAGEYKFEFVEYGFTPNVSNEELVIPKENVAGLQKV